MWEIFQVEERLRFVAYWVKPYRFKERRDRIIHIDKLVESEKKDVPRSRILFCNFPIQFKLSFFLDYKWRPELVPCAILERLLFIRENLVP